MTAPVPETQPERTALAWQRTGLGVLGIAALIGHRAIDARQPIVLAGAGLLGLLGLAVVGGLAPARYRRVRDAVRSGTRAAAPRQVAAVTAIVALTAAGTLATVLTRR